MSLPTQVSRHLPYIPLTQLDFIVTIEFELSTNLWICMFKVIFQVNIFFFISFLYFDIVKPKII